MIFIIGVRKIRKNRARKEELDKVSPHRRLSAFEASSVRRGMPIKEQKGNQLKIHNPIYMGEKDVLQMHEIVESEPEPHTHEGKTEVTFIDEVDDKSIGETNMSIDDKELLLPQEMQAFLENDDVYDVQDQSVGETNLAIDTDEKEHLLEEVKVVPETQKVASKVVTNAILSAIYSNDSEKTPLLEAEEEIAEDEMMQNITLTKELEQELAAQIPHRLSTASRESEEVMGLETISEESSSEQVVVEATVLEDKQHEQDALPDTSTTHEHEAGLDNSEVDQATLTNAPDTSSANQDDESKSLEDK